MIVVHIDCCPVAGEKSDGFKVPLQPPHRDNVQTQLQLSDLLDRDGEFRAAIVRSEKVGSRPLDEVLFKKRYGDLSGQVLGSPDSLNQQVQLLFSKPLAPHGAE